LGISEGDIGSIAENLVNYSQQVADIEADRVKTEEEIANYYEKQWINAKKIDDL
jgi:hypothetical protein